jgi:long-chain acyl-CoA synthetase
MNLIDVIAKFARMSPRSAAFVEVRPLSGLRQEISWQEFMTFFEQNLPRYKRPRRIIFDEVPRGPTGKIEKPKLRAKYAGKSLNS